MDFYFSFPLFYTITFFLFSFFLSILKLYQKSPNNRKLSIININRTSFDWHRSSRPSDYTISTPINCHRLQTSSDQSIIRSFTPIDWNRSSRQSDHSIFPSIDCHRLPRVYTLGWGVSRLLRWEPNFQERLIDTKRLRQLDFLDMNHEAT